MEISRETCCRIVVFLPLPVFSIKAFRLPCLAQFAQRLNFNLPDALPSQSKSLTDFFESEFDATIESEAHPNHLLFAGC